MISDMTLKDNTLGSSVIASTISSASHGGLLNVSGLAC